MSAESLVGTGFVFDAETSLNFMPTWVHESEPVWIREFEPVGAREHSNFYVFRSVSPPKSGQKPWAVDNRCIGDKTNPPRCLADALVIAAREVTP